MLFMQKFHLVDIWRKKNPNINSYTWSNKACTSMSRIDYWLVSDCLDGNNITVNIITTPLTDHRAVSLQVAFRSKIIRSFRGAYWKLNNSVLKHDLVIKKVQKLIKCFCNKGLIDKCFLRNWELFNFEVTKYLREYGSVLSKSRKIEETNVITRITALTQTSPENLSENDIQELILQQNK